METEKEKLIRFIRFLGENPRVWWSMTSDDNPDADLTCELIELLIQQEFLQLIPIVIGRSKALSIDDALHKLFLEKLCECWSNQSMQEITGEIRALLETVRQKKEK